MPAELTVATVLYGAPEVATKALDSWFAAFADHDVNFVIVDNSRGGEFDRYFESLNEHRNVRLVRQPHNPGFAQAANRAFEISPTAWVMLINPDVFITPVEGAAILGYAPTESTVTALSLRSGGQSQTGVCFTRYGLFVDRPSGSQRRLWGPSGGGMIIHRERFWAAGAFDEDLFAWGEDAALSIRLQKAGVEIGELDLGLDHIGGHSVSTLAGQRLKARLLARNRVIIARREFSRVWNGTIGVAHFVALVLNAVTKIRHRTIGAYIAGLVEGWSVPVTVDEPMTLRAWLRLQRG